MNLEISEIDYREVGKRLKEVRGTLSQAAFGEPLGYKYGYVKDCEHGKKPSIEYLLKVSNCYEVSLDWLIKGIVPIGSNNSKHEPIFDQDLKEMTDVLRRLLENDNSDMRGWTKVQFKKIFGEHY